MSFVIDSHCHLDFAKFDHDRDAVIENATKNNVAAIVNPGVDLKSSQEAIRIAEKYPSVYAAVGFHPHDARYLRKSNLEDLHQLAQHPQVVAIGEIGLDFYRDRSPRDVQIQAFQQQLGIAAEMDLPVIVHCRDAVEETFTILEEWADAETGRRGVLHAYSAGTKYLSRVSDLGFMIGIAGPVTFRKAFELHKVARDISLDKLLIETDAPFLAPEPYRGKRNQPAYVGYVAEAIGTIRGTSTDKVAEATTRNTVKLFGLKL